MERSPSKTPCIAPTAPLPTQRYYPAKANAIPQLRPVRCDLGGFSPSAGFDGLTGGRERVGHGGEDALPVEPEAVADHRLQLGERAGQRFPGGDRGRDGRVRRGESEPAEGAPEPLGRVGELLEQQLPTA